MLLSDLAIVGGDHVFNRAGTPIVFSGRPDMPETKIHDDAWIGYGAVIMSGISVGRGAIIAAGSVVTRDVPDYEIYAGVPAKKVRDRFTDDERATHDALLDGPVVSGDFCPPKDWDRKP